MKKYTTDQERENMLDPIPQNIAETLAQEMREPVELAPPGLAAHRIALPEGWNLAERDDEKMLPAPRRKTGLFTLLDADSFVTYTNRHARAEQTTVWCDANYTEGRVSFTSVINDHAAGVDAQEWRDFRALYAPRFSQEWKAWNAGDETKQSQFDFASFIEENLHDIVSVDGSPSGSEMLSMALSMETKQDVKFKSSIRLQTGGVELQYSDKEDDATLQKMKLYERFTIGLPVYWGTDAYQLSARLRYRVRDQKLTLWYELIRPDKVLEDATKTMIDQIRVGLNADVPFFYGWNKE
jgi:uncharacterized protein YfdQ (DUF2303 family)